jgi:TraM recognition site of TraD and TraG
MNDAHRGGTNFWGHLDDRLWWLAIPLALGAVLGVVFHLVLWQRRLRWTWAFAGVPLVAIAFAVDRQAGLASATAVATAAGIGGAWQGEALERGGSEAQAARERVGIWAGFSALVRVRRWRANPVREGRLAIGQTRAGTLLTVPFGQADGVRAFVPGAPGSGKTVTLCAHAVAYAREGFPVVCIDPKGDRSLRARLTELAASLERPFLEWTPDGPATYNPMERGTPSEIADKALAGEEFTEPHYLRQAQRYLGLELQAMRLAGEWPPTLSGLVRFLDAERLALLVERYSDERSAGIVDYVDGLSSRTRAELGGVRDRLAVLAESELGRWLEPRAGAPQIELSDAVRRQVLVYLQLDADRFPLASQMLGAAIVVDLVALSGSLQGGRLRGLIVVDEFAAIAADQISRLMSRSRAAGLSVLLATQSFADLTVARVGDTTESLRRQVLSHVDYVVAHRQSEPEAAELLGQMAGTKPAWASARKTRGLPWGVELGDDGTRRRTREFIRHPDEFKRLGTGEAIVIEPASGCEAEHVRVWSR